MSLPISYVRQLLKSDHKFHVLEWCGFFFPLWKSTGGIKERAMPVRWRNCSLFLTHCRNCLCERKIVYYGLSHLSLDVMRLVELLPCPSTALFDPEHPYRSRHCLMCRAAGCPSCMCVYLPLVDSGRMGKKPECFFFPSHLEVFITTASHPRHHRPPSGARAAGLMAAGRKGLIGGCFHFPVAKAGVSGSSAYGTWIAHNPISSWTVRLSPNFPTETDSLVRVDVWTVL